MLRILFLMVFAYTFAACGGDATTASEDTRSGEEHAHNHDGHDHDHDHDHDHEHPADEGDGIHFGAEITPDGGVSLADIIGKVDAGEGAEELDLGDDNKVQAIPTKVEGEVSEVCKKAGCWLKIATGDGQEMFIATNHEFFVPVDIVGKTVVVDGNAYKSVTTVEELKHFAEDEGQSEEEIAKITEPISEYKLLAKGLVVKQ